jgi:hypothetical protein
MLAKQMEFFAQLMRDYSGGIKLTSVLVIAVDSTIANFERKLAMAP